MSIQVFQQFQELVPEEWLERVTHNTLATVPLPEGPDTPGAIGVVVADDHTVRDLNKRYRGLDETTDVLSFSFGHQGEYYGLGEPTSLWSENSTFVVPPGEGTGLGEVIIAYPQAVRQARKSLRTPQQEVASLLIHGILHLLGFDHAQPEDDAAMKATEAKVLAQVLHHE